MARQKTIDIGRLYEWNELSSEQGFEQAGDFLHKTGRSFMEICYDFYEAIKEMPFAYGERQLTSALLPAFNRAATLVFVEQQLRRRYRRSK
jgi:hypothetical protein